MSDSGENELREEVARLSALVEDLEGRVKELEAIVRKDHRTLEEDHNKIENMEMTGKVNVRPVGL